MAGKPPSAQPEPPLNGTVQTNNPTGQLRMATTSSSSKTLVQRSQDFPGQYYVRVRAKVDQYGDAQGFTIHDGMHKLQVSFNPWGVTIFDQGGGETNVLPWSSDTNWHEYEVAVADGAAIVNIDGIERGRLWLQPFADGDYVAMFLERGANGASVHYDYMFVNTVGPIVENFNNISSWTKVGSGTTGVSGGLLAMQSNLDEQDTVAALRAHLGHVPHEFSRQGQCLWHGPRRRCL